MDIYTVKSGDNLWLISNRFKVSQQSIISANGLDRPEALVIGMNLLIPTPSPAATYVVRRGDTLSAIAKRFNITLSQLIVANNFVYPYTIYPGQVISIKSVVETMGYFIPSRVQNKAVVINSLARYLTYLAIFDFPVASDGRITGTPDADTVTAARRNGLFILPVLTNLRNGEFSMDIGHALVSNTQVRSSLINNIIAFLQSNNFEGVTIDFENLPPQDRNLFTEFIRLLYTQLHSVNKILVLNMAPKWEDWPEREWVGFFDYNRLGPIVDIAAIMTYEWGWRSGPPRATAPLSYVRRALDYAVSNNVPPGKILMGLTLFGYDWPTPYMPGNMASTVTLPAAWDLARDYRTDIVFNTEAMQPSIRYTSSSRQQREVWFEDALSHYHKYQLINGYGLRGVFYWLMDQPFQATWNMVSNFFTVKK